MTPEEMYQKLVSAVADSGEEWTVLAEKFIRNNRVDRDQIVAWAAIGMAWLARDWHRSQMSDGPKPTSARPRSKVPSAEQLIEAIRPLFRVMQGFHENKPFIQFNADDREHLATTMEAQAQAHTDLAEFVRKVDGICKSQGANTPADLPQKQQEVLAKEAPWTKR